MGRKAGSGRRLARGGVGGASRERGRGRLRRGRRALSGVGRGRCAAGTWLGAPLPALTQGGPARSGAERLPCAEARAARFRGAPVSPPPGVSAVGEGGGGAASCKARGALIKASARANRNASSGGLGIGGWSAECPAAGSGSPARAEPSQVADSSKGPAGLPGRRTLRQSRAASRPGSGQQRSASSRTAGSGAPRAPFLDAALVFEYRACRYDSAVSKYSSRIRECSGEQLLNEQKLPFFWEAADALHTVQVEIYTRRLQFAST